MAKKNTKKAEVKLVEKELEVNEFVEETVVGQPQEPELEVTDEVIETASVETIVGDVNEEEKPISVESIKESAVNEDEELYKTSDYTELERVLGRERTLRGDIYYGHKRK